ncbi:hypothetical protein TRFO_19493 [Tritrichomonas foetus]|uniref:Coiled-coil domain-containing protein 22 homolog n=1 Tax=Tritrichomonas foetus TaxID=1144522 RepID=A0A1J4KHY1_9EUKA|nr:hypothetical protein TRFO_19493 [Tritrichomonas foetus]|eukprot:OHT10999.1 hypothetical protein TRFO_19493 [Tritrichomonas foetus]
MSSDEIIVNQLKRINFKNANDFTNCANVTSPQLISACTFIFNEIPQTKGQIGDPPKSKALQFKFATQMADLAKGLNFAGDLSYDMFLNPKEDKTRAIIRFLLSKVPAQTATAASTAQGTSGGSLIISSAQSAFTEAKKKRPELLEPISQPLPLLNSGIPETTKNQIKEYLVAPKQPFFSLPILNNGVTFNEQCGVNSLASLLAQNDRESHIDSYMLGKQKPDMAQIKKITKRAFVVQPVNVEFTYQSAASQQKTSSATSKITSHLENIARFEYSTNDTNLGSTVVTATKKSKSKSEAKLSEIAEKNEEEKPKEEEEKHEEEEEKEPPLTNEQIANLKAELKEEKEQTLALLRQYEAQVSELEQTIEAEQEELEKYSSLLADLNKENERLVIELEKVKKVAQVSASDAREIKKLRSELVESVKNLCEIANDWEKKRVALIAEYRSIQSSIRRKDADRNLMMGKIAKLRKQLADAEDVINNSEGSIIELNKGINQQGDQLHRHKYVEMILEEIKKIEKQEAEVEKIRNDIRQQNQRMNQTIETVKRTWQLVDETVYSKAKEMNQLWMKKTYKMAVELLTLFESISEDVETSGKLSAQAMELDSKIERLRGQIDPEALERVENDLQTVQEEIDQIKGAQGGNEEAEQDDEQEDAEAEQEDDLDE